MLHGLLLLIAGVALFAVPFRRWRVGRSYGGPLLAVLSTLWLAEVALTLLGSASLPPEPPRSTPDWSPTPLPELEGQFAPRDFAAGPSDRPTALIVGDSFAAGQGVPDDEKLGSQLERALRDDVRVLTLAKPGWNAKDQLDAFATLGVRMEPDVVVWLFVYNDLGADTHPADDLIVRRRRTQRWPLRLLDRLAHIDWVLTVEAATTRAYRGALSPQNEDYVKVFRALTEVAAACRAAGVRPVFAPFPLLHALDRYPFSEEHARLLLSAREAGWDTVDLLPAFAGRDATTLWASRDDHHPNVEAHALATEVLARELRPFPDTGRRLDCGRLPLRPSLAQELLAACRSGSAEDLLRVAEAGQALDGAPAPRAGLPPGRIRGLHFAVVAAALAGGADAPGLRARAAAVIRAAQAPADEPAAPSTPPD